MGDGTITVQAQNTPPGDLVLSVEIPSAREVLEAFLGRRSSKNTKNAYASDFASLGRFLGTDGNGAVEALLQLDAGQANRVALGWMNALVAAGEAPKTRSRRLGTLRSFSKFARTTGMVSWLIEIESPRVKKLKNTLGPSEAVVHRMFEVCGDGLEGKRNRAILGMLATLGLRRAEVFELCVKHYDREEFRLSVLGKGQEERAWTYISTEMGKAIDDWLAAAKGAGFSLQPGESLVARRLIQPKIGGPLALEGLNYIVNRIAERAGVPRPAGRGSAVWPHALRHFAATMARSRKHELGDVQSFMRHASPVTTAIYDDELQKRGASVAADLGALLLGRRPSTNNP